MRYVGWWSGGWGIVAAIGLGLAFVVWSPGEVVTLLCTATLCIGVLLAFLAPGGSGDRPLPAFHWSRLCSRALVAGAAVVAFAAYAAAVPSLAWPLACVALLSSPPAVDRALRWRSGRRALAGSALRDPLDLPSPRATAVSAAGEAPAGVTVRSGDAGATEATSGLELSEQEVRELGTRDLCHRWRHSFLALENAATAAQRIRVVAQRQLFLDEMDRRSPTALAAWLASGARAAGGPERFLKDDAA